MLFEMLAGRPPFTAANPVGILPKHATAPVPHLWDLAPELEDQHELDELVQRGLEKLRPDRFQDAAEFVRAINATLVCLGANLTPIPTTANFATITPAPPSGMERAQTGPPEAHQAWNTTNAALLPANYHTGSTPTRPGRASSFGARQGIIAVAIIALLAGALWATTRSSGTPGNTSVSKNKDLLFGQYVTALKEGKTCQDRLLAVKALAVLNDERAIPELKRARRRMRGGALGFGASNTNRCLRKAAQEAIKSLSK
jgi:serine/threonine protein kinase